MDSKQRQMDYNQTFNSEHGDRVLKDLITRNYLVQPTDPRDANVCLYQAGKRDVILEILLIMKKTPQDLLTTVEELSNE